MKVLNGELKKIYQIRLGNDLINASDHHTTQA